MGTQGDAVGGMRVQVYNDRVCDDEAQQAHNEKYER